MSEALRYELRESVAAITLDDGKANVLSPAVITAFHAALDRAEREAGGVLITGREKRLSGGFDMSVMTSNLDAMRALVISGAELLLRVYLFPRPVVVACNGHAVAAGALLLLAADRRIGAAGDFKIGLNEVAIHMPLPVFGMELARARLSKRYLTAATTQATIYDPQGARDAGYLDEVVAVDELSKVAAAAAQRLASLPHPAFHMTKLRERSAIAQHIRDTLVADVTDLTTPKTA